jgi:hypothetical protein
VTAPLHSDDGDSIFTPADSIEDKVERLGKNERFMQSLTERSKNRTGRALEDIERDLASEAE